MADQKSVIAEFHTILYRNTIIGEFYVPQPIIEESKM